MTPEDLPALLAEFGRFRELDADPELEALKIAILLEDVFDVVLADANIDLEILGDASAVAALVALRQRESG